MHHAHIDKYANGNTVIHNLDGRCKLVVTVVFTLLVIIDGRGTGLFWYALWPFAMLAFGDVPFKFAAKQLLYVSPFIFFLAISSIFFEKGMTDVNFGPFSWRMSSGWIKFYNIIFRFAITVCSLIALVSTTRFDDLLAAMEKLGMPRLFVAQLGFLYRYIFLLIDRVGRMLRARSARRLKYLGFASEMKVAGSMIGGLLISSIDMAQRTGAAMEARGFDGHVRTLNKMQAGGNDVVFVCVSLVYLSGLLIFL